MRIFIGLIGSNMTEGKYKMTTIMDNPVFIADEEKVKIHF